jgi:uncharacterized protein
VRALILIAALLLAACAREGPQSDSSPALWEVSGPKGMPGGWLFGTVHALPREVEWRTPRLDQSLGGAQVLVVEVANVGDDKALADAFRRIAIDRASPPLLDRIEPPARTRLSALLAREGVSARQFDKLETWAAALAIARLAGSGEPAQGVDRALIASFAGRPVVELEGAAAQLAIFDRLPEQDQRDLLIAVVREGERAESLGAELAEAWASGDLARLEQLAMQGMLEDPELRQALLIARNRAWAERIARLIARGEQPFVAVGAAHLLGKDGIPALLANQGYTVRRIQ